MLARLSLIALCAVVATRAAANPTGPTVEVCIGRLADSVKGVSVPAPIRDFIAAVEANVPYNDGQDWDDLDEEAEAKYHAIYPAESCKKYLDEMGEKFGAVFASEECSDQLSYSVKAIKLANADPVIGPIMKANKACDAFEPEEQE